MNRRLRCERVLTDRGWRADVALELDEGGLIQAVEAGPVQSGEQTITGAVIPGMPNVHSHGFQRLIAGLGGRRTGNDSFWTWREAMYRVAGRLGPEELGACMAGLYLELLRGGFTSCAEFHYLHRDPSGAAYADPAELSHRVLDAAGAAGMPLTLLPVLYRRSAMGAEDVAPAQVRFRLDLDDYGQLLDRCRIRAAATPGARVGVAPHSLRAVGAADLEALLQLAGEDEPVHIHVAEQPAEVNEALAHLGARPLAWLLDHAPVDERWCLVHATHLDDRELRTGAATGAVAGLCPTTEADLGDGLFRAREWLEAGGRFGVGSDSNLRLEATEELRLLEFGQRLRDGGRNLLARDGENVGQALWEGAADGGARAIGQPVGRLAPGRRADFLVLDTSHALLDGLADEALLDAFVFAGSRDMIAGVWVAGERVVHRGRHAQDVRMEADMAQVLRRLRA